MPTLLTGEGLGGLALSSEQVPTYSRRLLQGEQDLAAETATTSIPTYHRCLHAKLHLASIPNALRNVHHALRSKGQGLWLLSFDI